MESKPSASIGAQPIDLIARESSRALVESGLNYMSDLTRRRAAANRHRPADRGTVPEVYRTPDRSHIDQAVRSNCRPLIGQSSLKGHNRDDRLRSLVTRNTLPVAQNNSRAQARCTPHRMGRMGTVRR